MRFECEEHSPPLHRASTASGSFSYGVSARKYCWLVASHPGRCKTEDVEDTIHMEDEGIDQ